MNLVTLPVWLVLTGTCLASTYFVSPTGNDAWQGTAAQPWATPGFGSKHMAGGDTLIILSGDYVMAVFHDDMLTPPSGSPGAPTVVIGQGPTRPRFLGTGSLFSCINIEDGSHIVIKNLECTSLIDSPYSGGARAGINAGSDVHDLVFEDIEIHRTEQLAFNLGGDAEDISIRRCSIHHNGYTALGGPGALGDGWVNVLIDSCYLSYSGHFYDGQDQPSPWDRPDGLGFEASEGPIEVRYTIAEHNRGDGLDSKSRHTSIHHCVVANNFADGVKLWGDSTRVSNTLIYGTGDGDNTPTPWCLLVIGTDDAGGLFEITNVTMWDSPARHPHYTASIQYDEATTPTTLVLKNVIVSGL
ncbi:MAG: right-handed parallel beta-helix repeat-containing protein, partial [Candidatus Eisenbacteria bacterium]|nr:right-handed parallel beta-helix repeat-containing protein [Candidatus Eisenbacteria bacterium]